MLEKPGYKEISGETEMVPRHRVKGNVWGWSRDKLGLKESRIRRKVDGAVSWQGGEKNEV